MLEAWYLMWDRLDLWATKTMFFCIIYGIGFYFIFGGVCYTLGYNKGKRGNHETKLH